MRVSESLIYSRMARSTTTARARLEAATKPLLTGKKATRPSEHPLHAQRVARVEREMTRAQQYTANISRVQIYHQMVETTITNATDILDQMNVTALAMANTQVDDGARQAAAAEVSQLLDSLQSLANAKYDGRYLFSGRMQDKPAYDPAFQFQGDAEGRTLPIGDNLTIKGDVTGPQVFGEAGSTAFEAAENLVAALENNDVEAIQSAMEEIQAAHKQAVEARMRVGFTMSDLQSVLHFHEENLFTQEVQRAQLDDVDIARAASEMAFAENVYQSSIETAKRLTRMLDAQLQL